MLKISSRREFLRAAIPATGLAPLVTGCRTDSGAGEAKRRERVYDLGPQKQTGPTRELRLVAAPGETEIGPDRTYTKWLYNGKFPGPEIRVKAGERLRVTLDNKLPEETTIHWHGIPVPNKMDGVPGLTQKPVQPGERFIYDFVAGPAGSYMYHSHVKFQLDRGLVGPLIVEPRSEAGAYDREYVLILDDLLEGAPQPLGGRRMGGMMGGMMRGGMMMGVQVPPYSGLLINGRLPEDPTVFLTRRGMRLRLRVLNPSGATTFRLAIGGHPITVTHTDGRPVKPTTVDALYIAMGERYDLLVECNRPGAWPIMAASVEGSSRPALAILRYEDAAQSSPPADAIPEGLQGGRVLEIDDLQGLEEMPSGSPDRTFDLALSGGMMTSAWTINGQVYPDAEGLEIHRGERVRVSMVNHSMMIHPMHLHGHFYRVGNAFKDTVIVLPHMGRRTFEFLADNPGDWLFHCHNLYHMNSGMARVFRYT